MTKFFDFILIPLFGFLAVLSATILIVSTPPVWAPIYQSVMNENLEKKYPAFSDKVIEDAVTISDGLWSNKSYQEINQSLHFKVLKKKEMAHFEDVRSLLRLLIYPLSAGVLLLFIWSFILKNKIRWYLSLIYCLSLCGSLSLWGLINWRHMFRTLHWWIFQNDSWILPKKSYSLTLYPYSVWQTAAVVVVSLVFFILVTLAIRSFVRRPKSHDIVV